MGNITSIVFDKESAKTIYKDLWQYDYGQILRIEGLDLPKAVEIHFSLQETGGEAKRRIGITDSGITDVVIPDFILEGNKTTRDYYAYAFIYVANEESGETTHKIKMSIKSRPEPEGNTGRDDTSFGAIMAAVNKIAEGKADGLKYEYSILKLMSGETEIARVTIDGESAREIELQKGERAIQWRYVGEETWKDLVSLDKLKGTDGKSAYEYAKEGGYTGTEDEFRAKQADEWATKDEVSKLSSQISDLEQNGTGGKGWTTEQIDLLDSLLNLIPFTSFEAGTIADRLITSLRNNAVEPDNPSDNPDVESGVVQDGRVLTIIHGVATSQNGTTLLIA